MLARLLPRLALSEELRRGSKAYDLLAAVPLLVWYGLTAIGQSRVLLHQLAQLTSGEPSLGLAIAILSKLAAFLFAVIVIGLLFARRPPKSGTDRILPKAMAILGTYLTVAILALPQPHLPVWALAASTVLIFSGSAFSVYALIFLGRSISLMPEARKLVTSGPYTVVRHPLYLGEGIALTGTVIQYISPWAVLLFAAQICCQLYRMGCEEEVLTEAFPEYDAYSMRSFRVIPGLY